MPSRDLGHGTAPECDTSGPTWARSACADHGCHRVYTDSKIIAGQALARTVREGAIGKGPEPRAPRRRPTSLARWNQAGVVTFIRDQLRRHIRTDKGRCPFPVMLIVDSQSVKAASTVGRDSRGYDAGKKINGRKRHLVVDTLGLPVMITVTAGDVRDEIIARDLLWRLRLTHPQITQIWADSAYARDLLPAWTAETCGCPCGRCSAPGRTWVRRPSPQVEG
nr:transposase [Streptomyces sp. NRRL S-920]